MALQAASPPLRGVMVTGRALAAPTPKTAAARSAPGVAAHYPHTKDSSLRLALYGMIPPALGAPVLLPPVVTSSPSPFFWYGGSELLPQGRCGRDLPPVKSAASAGRGTGSSPSPFLCPTFSIPFFPTVQFLWPFFL